PSSRPQPPSGSSAISASAATPTDSGDDAARVEDRAMAVQHLTYGRPVIQGQVGGMGPRAKSRERRRAEAEDRDSDLTLREPGGERRSRPEARACREGRVDASAPRKDARSTREVDRRHGRRRHSQCEPDRDERLFETRRSAGTGSAARIAREEEQLERQHQAAGDDQRADQLVTGGPHRRTPKELQRRRSPMIQPRTGMTITPIRSRITAAISRMTAIAMWIPIRSRDAAGLE